jgi:outer membrane lipopolysaccharide assembly protein LptE/RlpB
MKFVAIISLSFFLAGCWPTSVSFVDGTMPEEWKTFYVTGLENNAANTPLSYSANLSESLRNGIQNNTRLLINSNSDKAELNFTGTIMSYSITPVALQEGDDAAKNRLTISVRFEIFVSKPEEDEITMTSTRFVDYDVNTDISEVETELLSEVNNQIVQDVINKLMSNW